MSASPAADQSTATVDTLTPDSVATLVDVSVYETKEQAAKALIEFLVTRYVVVAVHHCLSAIPLLRFKALFQMLVGLPYDVVRPSISFGRGSIFSRCMSADKVFCQVFLGLPTGAVPFTTNLVHAFT